MSNLKELSSSQLLVSQLVSGLAEITSLISENELSRNLKVYERIKRLRSLVIEAYSIDRIGLDPNILKNLKPLLGEF